MVPFEEARVADAAFKRDPHPFYRRLRRDTPVCRIRLASGQEAYLLARYDDVVILLRDSRFAKDRTRALTPEQLARQPWMPSFFKPLMQSMIDRDDPDHARLRRLVQMAFTPRRIVAMDARIRALADELLDGIAGRRTFDLISDFALKLPVTIISEMLGVPEEDRPRFARWSQTMIKNTMTPWSTLRSLPHLYALIQYVRALSAKRRAVPQDDLVTALVQAEETGESLSEDELLAMIVLLLTAGHETTVNLIGNGMLAMMQNPEQLEHFRSDPALAPTAIEELLRYASPVEMTTPRFAREDILLGEALLPRGALVLGIIASANRDASHFPNADQLDLTRDPNKHLTFGQGGHYCVGAPLARREGTIALTTLLRRFPKLQSVTTAERLRWRPGLVLRGLESLPVRSNC